MSDLAGEGGRFLRTLFATIKGRPMCKWKCLHVHVSSAACWTKQRYQFSFPTSCCNWQLASSGKNPSRQDPLQFYQDIVSFLNYDGATSASFATQQLHLRKSRRLSVVKLVTPCSMSALANPSPVEVACWVPSM